MKRRSADIQLINGHKQKKKMKGEEGKKEDFSTDSNSWLKFHIVDSNKEPIDDIKGVSMRKNNAWLVPFSPMFTHQIFSSYERIRGYTGLKINLYLSWATLKWYLKIRYSKKAAKCDDIEKLLSKHFGDNLTVDPEKFQEWMTSDLEDFKPIGKKVYEFDRIQDKHRHYEVYKIGLNDKNFSSSLNRSLQAMFFFYIESASFIEKDSSWNYFLLYEVVKRSKSNPLSYRLIGYSTSYETIKGKRAYNRISQFLILPSYQKQNFGKSLVEGIYDHYINDPMWEELNVEKPTNAFKRLRDSVENNLVIKKGFLKAIDNLVLGQVDHPEKELLSIVGKIHENLKISNSRIIKILQNHYLSKKELIYKQSSNAKNWYSNFKQVISAVKTMMNAHKVWKRDPLHASKWSPKLLRSLSNGRQGMKNPRKRLREDAKKQAKLERSQKLKSYLVKSKKANVNTKVSSLSTSSLIESWESDSDSEWKSPGHNERYRVNLKVENNLRNTKRQKISDNSELHCKPNTRRNQFSDTNRLEKVVVTWAKI